MRLIINVFLFIGVFSMASCSNSKKESSDLVVGGLYVSENDDGSFGVSKVLALDDFTVHVRMYTDEFKTKPTDLNSADLDYFIGHAPLATEGFLLNKPELLKVERVSDEELEGYKYYLDAMKNQ